VKVTWGGTVAAPEADTTSIAAAKGSRRIGLF